MSPLPHISFPTPGHADLVRRAVETFGPDERIVGLFLAGSLATGEGDEESDLDLTLVVDDGALDGVWEGLEFSLRSIGYPVAVAPGPMPLLLTALMRDGLRLDVAVETRSGFGSRPRRPLVALYDPLAIGSGLEVASPHFEPTREWLDRHVADFLRFLDQLNVIVLRGEWIAGVDNAWYLMSRLVDLYAHLNRAPRTSARRVNVRLTPAQTMAFASLPAMRADEPSVLAVHLAVTRLYLIEARALAEALRVRWPTELEQTVLEHLRTRTGSDFSP